ncbi:MULTISPECIES: hypothetical protein [unclassified Thioalkalivibrio]|uniref:hypothetical protein n=2 Tax=Thioalkalivibrio TaxID=106633 RepID=UPI000370744E|nr:MULTISPECIES: hypothetical protein [unclassified Thioalkalivibrio]
MDRSTKQLLMVVLILALVLALAYLLHYHMQIRAVNNLLERLGVIQSEATEQLVKPALEGLRSQQERLEQQQRREEAIRQREAAEARRERAFERAFIAQYEVPEGCDSWDSEAQMVKCTNHRIRARREFRAEFFREPAPNQLLLEGTRR